MSFAQLFVLKKGDGEGGLRAIQRCIKFTLTNHKADAVRHSVHSFHQNCVPAFYHQFLIVLLIVFTNY